VVSASVLVIDDDHEMVRQMMATFANAGWRARGAFDGEAGLEAFKERPTDLVVCDIIMPVREGIETIMTLRQTHPGVKIIAVSGGLRLGSSTVLTLAAHLGADEVLAKPFRPSALLALAAGLMGRGAEAAA